MGDRIIMKPSIYGDEFDRFADEVLNGIGQMLGDKLLSYSGPMPEAVAHYAAIAGIITAAGWQTRAMKDLYDLNPEPLIGVLEEQFREGMKGPTNDRG